MKEPRCLYQIRHIHGIFDGNWQLGQVIRLNLDLHIWEIFSGMVVIGEQE